MTSNVEVFSENRKLLSAAVFIANLNHYPKKSFAHHYLQKFPDNATCFTDRGDLKISPPTTTSKELLRLLENEYHPGKRIMKFDFQ
jgi:hypothetical protein